VGGVWSQGGRATPKMSALTDRVAVYRSAWTDLVPRTGADLYQEGRAAECLA